MQLPLMGAAPPAALVPPPGRSSSSAPAFRPLPSPPSRPLHAPTMPGFRPSETSCRDFRDFVQGHRAGTSGWGFGKGLQGLNRAVLSLLAEATTATGELNLHHVTGSRGMKFVAADELRGEARN